LLAIAEEFPGEVGELAAVLVLQFLLEETPEEEENQEEQHVSTSFQTKEGIFLSGGSRRRRPR